jgi:hypothetical protein
MQRATENETKELRRNVVRKPHYSYILSCSKTMSNSNRIRIYLIQLSNLAEREGFEPSRSFHPCRVSSAVPSTTQPSLRIYFLKVLPSLHIYIPESTTISPSGRRSFSEGVLIRA